MFPEQRFLPLLIFYIAFIAMSPLFFYFGFRGIFSITFVVGMVLFLTILLNKKFKKWFIELTVLTLFSSIITGIYWGDARYILANVFFIAACFLQQHSSQEVTSKVIDIASLFLLTITFGAVIGFICAYIGMKSIWDFQRPYHDNQTIQLFLTTLTNSSWDNIIRPAGIYDEPGALSFYLCGISAMRHLYRKNNKYTWVLLLLGFVTLSLAHLIYVFFHLLAWSAAKRNIKILVISFLVVLSLVYTTGFNNILETKLFHRLSISKKTGMLEGDNRSLRMFNVIEIIKEQPLVILFGAEPSCRFNPDECNKIYSKTGENPLTLVFANGLFVSWPYYVSLIILLFSPFYGKFYFVSFGYGLLLLQRPELVSLSGAMMSVIVIFTTISKIKNEKLIVIAKPLMNFTKPIQGA